MHVCKYIKSKISKIIRRLKDYERARQKTCRDSPSLFRNGKSASRRCNFPSNNFARHRGMLRARPYGNRRREDRRERRSSNHIVEEHERGNMNNISARRTAGVSRAAEREATTPRREKKRETKRARHSLGRQRLRRRKKREGARVGTTPWLVGSFDLLPPRDGPLPSAIPLRAGPVLSRSRSFTGRYRCLASSAISFPRGSALSLPSLVS